MTPTFSLGSSPSGLAPGSGNLNEALAYTVKKKHRLGVGLGRVRVRVRVKIRVRGCVELG